MRIFTQNYQSMPINKDALNRIRIIDEMLAHPFGDYTTEDILKRVNGSCGMMQREVSLRMIQKDIKAIQEQFGKKIIRHVGYGGRRTVRYEDQSQPIFSQQLTDEEATVLREALNDLGQFDGLENLQWLEALRKRLDERGTKSGTQAIVFSRNEQLRTQPRMLGRLFSAITHKTSIEVAYKRFGEETKHYIVSPYQLKQYNDRWFLLCAPETCEEFDASPELIINLALDRIVDFTERPGCYKELEVDLQSRFDEIIGITYRPDVALEEVVFAVAPSAIPYIETKPLHITQMRYPNEEQSKMRSKYPVLHDFTFYSIEVRPNYEFYSLLVSFQGQIIVVAPLSIAKKIKSSLAQIMSYYLAFDEK